MRILEVRRHSLTKLEAREQRVTSGGSMPHRGSYLSAQGVALARSIGGRTPFAYVRTSDTPRAIETAIAMGYAVDDAMDLPSGYVPGEVEHHVQWDWPEPYVRYAELIRAGEGLTRNASALRLLWIGVLKRVPDGGAALVVGDGGSIEPALVACFPEADHATWGPPLGHCEGARLMYDGEGFTAVEFLRV